MRQQSTVSIGSFKSCSQAAKASPYKKPMFVFEKELPAACLRFECPGVVVTKGIHNDDFYKSLKFADHHKRVMKKLGTPTPRGKQDSPEENNLNVFTGTVSLTTAIGEGAILVEAIYNSHDELVEILFNKPQTLPRVLMQCVTLLIPHFRCLNKMSFIKSRLNIYTIHELNKMLLISSLTEISFDGSYLPEGCYALLLETKTRLQYLSLSKCRIGDEICALIAKKLYFGEPAETHVAVLNLSSNRITDEGAKCLAEALRTNRHLRYLNLAGNHITDKGAAFIFHMLKEFPLTSDEIIKKRMRYMTYLRQRRELYLRYLDDLETKSTDDVSLAVSRKSMLSRKSKATSVKRSKKDNTPYMSDDYIHLKAKMMAQDVAGEFTDPFGINFIIVKHDFSYCIGNFVLCYLNLSYNKLSFCSLRLLQSVLTYQIPNKRISESGLLKVVLDGNPLPKICREYDLISHALANSVMLMSGTDAARKRNHTAKNK